MNSTDFTYWLQGFVELTETETISEKQWLVIKDHLKLVFDKKTPDRSDYVPSKSIEQILSEQFKRPKESYWKLGDPPLVATC